MRRQAAEEDEGLSETGPSTLVQPLFEAGRFKAAAAVLARLEDDGAPSWETLLWRARIAEKEGRWAAAKRAFSRALAARPDAVDLELDLARFLEERGRLSEAEAHLKRALKLKSRNAEVRLALARLHRRQGRPGTPAADPMMPALRSERDLVSALRTLAPKDPGAWLQGVLSLVRAGRFSPRLERSFRAAPEACVRSWSRVFSALLCSRRYDRAFGLAEAMLRRLGPPESPWELLWPWFMGIPSAVGQGLFCAQELARVERAARRGGFPRWFAFCRAVLLDQLARRHEAWAQHAAVARPPRRLYAWMRQSFVLTLINLREPRRAAALARQILRRYPRHEWMRLRLRQALRLSRELRRP
jgi:tetratricopeptide (TPR) repeat protein